MNRLPGRRQRHAMLAQLGPATVAVDVGEHHVKVGVWQPPPASHQDQQQRRALEYLASHAHAPGQETVARAAVILRAGPGAPAGETMLGVKPWAVTGRTVRCRSCKHRYTCSASDPYYGTGWNNGLCFGCLLAKEIIPQRASAGDTPGAEPLGGLDETAETALAVFNDAHDAEPDNEGGET